MGRDYGPDDIHRFRPEEAFKRLRTVTAGTGLQVSGHVWQGQTLRMAAAYGPELRRVPTIDVVLGANATELVLADDHERVRSIVFKSLDGRRFELAAETYVLTAGALEVPRLLLASNRQLPAGVGNDRDLVGRFFMEHPKHKRGTLRPGPELREPLAAFTAERPRPRPQVSFSLSDEVQREQALLGHALYLKPRYRDDIVEEHAKASAARYGLGASVAWRARAWPSLARLAPWRGSPGGRAIAARAELSTTTG